MAPLSAAVRTTVTDTEPVDCLTAKLAAEKLISPLTGAVTSALDAAELVEMPALLLTPAYADIAVDANQQNAAVVIKDAAFVNTAALVNAVACRIP